MSKAKIYIAGHHGMVGSSCWKLFQQKGYKNLIGKNSKELDLKVYHDVYNYISKNKPTHIILAAARVGGILANSKNPYSFILENLLIQNNIIRTSYELGIKNLIFLGSSCIYPKESRLPIKEEYLLSGKLEETNEQYAIAKIAGIKLVEAIRKESNLNYFSLMPCNLYGPNDNFDYETSHVIPALIRKFHDAKTNNLDTIKLWGTGKPYREFLHVDDIANAILFCMENKMNESIYNVGSGDEISIYELSKLIKRIVGFKGNIEWDDLKPDGTHRKVLDSSRIKYLGWSQKIALEEGIKSTYDWFRRNFLVQ